MHLILFILALVVSRVVVLIGAIAFELTGMEKSTAQFQALSCFSGTGFTTRESEQITRYPLRRKIAMFLMILGNAGFVTLIATFANSLSPRSFLVQFESSTLPSFFSSTLGILLNLVILVLAGYLIYKISKNKILSEKIRDGIRTYLSRKHYLQSAPFEEFFVTSTGYGVVRIEMTPASPLLNKAIAQTPLSENGISVLVLERGDQILHHPPDDTPMAPGDGIVCFGPVERLQSLAGLPVSPEETR